MWWPQLSDWPEPEQGGGSAREGRLHGNCVWLWMGAIPVCMWVGDIRGGASSPTLNQSYREIYWLTIFSLNVILPSPFIQNFNFVLSLTIFLNGGMRVLTHMYVHVHILHRDIMYIYVCTYVHKFLYVMKSFDGPQVYVCTCTVVTTYLPIWPCYMTFRTETQKIDSWDTSGFTLGIPYKGSIPCVSFLNVI